MRRGRVVATYAGGDVTESEMAEQMIGDIVPARHRAPRSPLEGDAALQVLGVSVRDTRGQLALDDVSFAVHAGEIFGIAGVDGNGQRQLFELLVGLLRPAIGSIAVRGAALSVFTPRAALAAGIAHIPPDRQREGLVLPMTVQENFLLNRAILDRVSWYGVLRRDAARAFADDLARRYALHFADLDAPVRTLSGGNQQRVVVARELAQHPHVLVTVNPTRGLDVAAAAAVGDALIEIARQGCAVVLISTDLDEVLDLSDRVSVMSRGRLSAALAPPIDTERLGLLMAGAAPEMRPAS